MSIGSGSCGNSYYLGVGDYGILIDAGIPSKTIRMALKKEGIAFESICAVFIDAGNIWTIRNYEEQPGGQFRITTFYKDIA